MIHFKHSKPPPDPRGESLCWSCQNPVNHDNHCGAAGVEVCLSCWNRVSIYDRIQIAMQVNDRAPGGYLAELADALQRFEKDDSDDWKSGDGD